MVEIIRKPKPSKLVRAFSMRRIRNPTKIRIGRRSEGIHQVLVTLKLLLAINIDIENFICLVQISQSLVATPFRGGARNHKNMEEEVH